MGSFQPLARTAFILFVPLRMLIPGKWENWLTSGIIHDHLIHFCISGYSREATLWKVFECMNMEQYALEEIVSVDC